MEILNLLFIAFLIYLFLGIFVLLYLGLWGFTLKPVITTSADLIIASPSKIYLFLTSYLYVRMVTINNKSKIVTVSVKFGWLFNFVRKIHFDEVNKIKYDYITLCKDENDQTEEFVVSLMLKNDEEKKLFSFIGNESSGSQEDSSRSFVELISKFMDKNLT
jgi:hypothetical protein